MRIVTYDEQQAQRYVEAAFFLIQLRKLRSVQRITEKQFYQLRAKALMGDVPGADRELRDILDSVRTGRV